MTNLSPTFDLCITYVCSICTPGHGLQRWNIVCRRCSEIGSSQSLTQVIKPLINSLINYLTDQTLLCEGLPCNKPESHTDLALITPFSNPTPTLNQPLCGGVEYRPSQSLPHGFRPCILALITPFFNPILTLF